jgi:hypothetical protein
MVQVYQIKVKNRNVMNYPESVHWATTQLNRKNSQERKPDNLAYKEQLEDKHRFQEHGQGFYAGNVRVVLIHVLSHSL